MASLEGLIRAKTDRLESIPDELLTGLQKVQRQVLPEVNQLLSLLERDGSGKILLTEANLDIVRNLQGQLRDVLLGSEYTEMIAQFADEFSLQQGITDALLVRMFPDFVKEAVLERVVEQYKLKTVDTFINGITDEAFADAIQNRVQTAVVNNESYVEALRSIQEIVTGNDEVDGKIQQYAKQISHDAFSLSDAAYTSAASESIDAEWYFYSGSVIKSSREFCVERHNKYFYYKEVEAWAKLEWSGKNPETNEQNIYEFRGGFACRHSIIPVSIAIVPKDVIERNIANGNFVPSDFERKELGV